MGSTVEEPEMVSVPVKEDSAGDPVFEQATKSTAPARIPAMADRIRAEWVKGFLQQIGIGSPGGSAVGLNRSSSTDQGHVK